MCQIPIALGNCGRLEHIRISKTGESLPNSGYIDGAIELDVREVESLWAQGSRQYPRQAGEGKLGKPERSGRRERFPPCGCPREQDPGLAFGQHVGNDLLGT